MIAAKQQLADISENVNKDIKDQINNSIGPNAQVRLSENIGQIEEIMEDTNNGLRLNLKRLISVEDAFVEYDLTSDQKMLISCLTDFLQDSTSDVFILRGYAGTGKTFICKGLTEYFDAIGRNYVLAAPTGKASKVVARKTQTLAYTIHKTIYSFDDIKEYKIDGVDGSETYKFYADLAINEGPVDTVYIVDEASMVSNKYQEEEFFRFGTGFLLSDFLKYTNLDHNDHRKKIIFIGDAAQLPPVGMSSSPALSSEYLSENFNLNCKGFELKKVVRQKSESGILIIAIKLREMLESKKIHSLKICSDSEDVDKVIPANFMNEYLRSCNNLIGEESIVIAHSNADVAKYNNRIREHFFPGLTDIQTGDRVIATTNSNYYGFFITNGDFGDVEEVHQKQRKVTVTIRNKNKETGVTEEIKIDLEFIYVRLTFLDFENVPRTFDAVVIGNLLYSDKPHLSSDERKALYVDFVTRYPKLKRNSLEFKETLKRDPYFNALRIKFGYSITCHKAQGSEWEHVFVKCTSHQQQLSKGYVRWLYTAITRSHSKLYLIDPPEFVPPPPPPSQKW